MTEEQYDAFIAALGDGDKMSFKEFETNTPYFDGCMPGLNGGGARTANPSLSAQ